MESGNYDSRAVNWAHPMSNSTHLPPKSPHGNTYSMFSSTSLFETGSLPQQQQPTHRRSPSAGYVPTSQQGSWLSAGSPDIVLKRCSHRRSSSDSVAFVDNSYQYMNCLEHVTEEEEFLEPDHAYRPAHRRGVSADHGSGDHSFQYKLPATHRSYPEKSARGDPNVTREQFARLEPFQRQQQNLAAYNRAKTEDRGKVKKHVTLATPPPKSDNPPRGRSLSWSVTSFENRSTASESNSHSDDSIDDARVKSYERFRGDPEEGADCTSSDQVDPKKAKRILANRQSAQRSRVRKLQYISELEMNVNLLETEVASLSPKVVLFDRERQLVSAENALLKQKLAAFSKTQRLKEVYNETLKAEVQRLRQLQQTQQYSSQQQQLQQQQQQPYSPQQQQQPLSPDSVELQLLRFSKLDLGPPNLPKSPTGYSPQGRMSSGKPSLYPISPPINNSRIMRSPGARGGVSPPSCMAPIANTSASFMVHNSL